MAKEPDKKPPPPVSKDGTIPPEHFDDDLRCPDDADVDTSPGSIYDALAARVKNRKLRDRD